MAGPRKPNTARDYRSALDKWLLPEFGRRKLHEVTSRAIRQWRSVEMAEGRLKRRTAVKVTAILHGIFEQARRDYDFPGNRSPTSSRSGSSHSMTRAVT